MSDFLEKELTDSLDSGGAIPGFFSYFVTTNNYLPGWYSVERDLALRNEVIKNGFLASVVNVVLLKLMNLPFHIQSKDSNVGAHYKLAQQYDAALQYSLNRDLEKFLMDVLVCDNGGFLFVEGNTPTDQPLTSLPTGLRHLDAARVQRTGNYEFPYLYTTLNGKMYKLHESRVISVTQFPSADSRMFGVGYSFVSRCFLLAQHLLDIANYEGESLGSRSSEEIIYGTGTTSNEIMKAFKFADIESDNSGLLKVGKRVFIGLRDPNGKLGKILLKNMPEYFNKRDDIEITLTLVALASGGQSTWFYDAVKSGSTRASSQEATKMGESKLINWWLKRFSEELQYKFCNENFRVIAGLQDDDFDGTKSRIRVNAANVRNINLSNGVTNIRIERELQLQRGEITNAQFELLELSDGRLENGLPIFALFQTNEESLRKLLYFVPEPLEYQTLNWETDLRKLKDAILQAQGMALNGKTIYTQSQSRRAMFALLWLEEQYRKYIISKPELNQFLQYIDTLPNLSDYTNNPNQSLTNLIPPSNIIQEPRNDDNDDDRSDDEVEENLELED